MEKKYILHQPRSVHCLLKKLSIRPSVCKRDGSIFTEYIGEKWIGYFLLLLPEACMYACISQLLQGMGAAAWKQLTALASPSRFPRYGQGRSSWLSFYIMLFASRIELVNIYVGIWKIEYNKLWPDLPDGANVWRL